jgi:rubrerythrin
MIGDWLRRVFKRTTVYRECRRCGKTIIGDTKVDACPQCGHTGIAVYKLP